MHTKRISQGAALAALLASAVSADNISVNADRDNTLYVDFAGELSNGAGPNLFVGRNTAGEVRRALVRFNLDAVPPGSTINSVTLKLYMSRTRAGNEFVSVHRVTADWGEAGSVADGGGGQGGAAETGDATWQHRFYNTTYWAVPGGDYAVSASATTTVGATLSYYTWTSPQLAADVANWINNPGTNFGWIVIGNESTNTTAKRFESRESFDPTLVPRLSIDFTPPPGTGACCVPGGYCYVTTPAGCAAFGGSYQGNGVECQTDPCGFVVGACCLPSGECISVNAADCTLQGGTYRGDGVPCGPGLCPVILTPFVDQLPTPPVAVPTSGTIGGTASYTITMNEFYQRLHRDLPDTRVWGYNFRFPGPTILASTGNPVTVTWVNDLRDEFNVLRTTHVLPVDFCLHGASVEPRTVVHLHGGKVPASADGYPEDAFLPGQSLTYVYPNNQLPAMLWYHDHALGLTRLNVYMGLAGGYIVRDPIEQALNLPSGTNEIPLVIQDRSFNPDGSLYYPESWHEHFFGDKILVNGKVWPFKYVNRGKYRFRVLNGCNSRTLTLALSNGASFKLIGLEGGLLAAPVTLTSITLGPAERADIIVDFAPFPANTEIILTNSAPAPYPGQAGVGVIPNVMKFIVTTTTGHTAAVPNSLRSFTPLPEASATRSRDFLLRQQPEPCAGSRWLINDLLWMDITEFPRFGETEIWSFVNASGVSHPMHMHLVHFQVLDRQNFDYVNGQVLPTGPRVPPPASEVGWKDTVMAHPFQITRVIARFDGYTGLFPYHCHILEHEDHEMMRQFRVVYLGDADRNGTVNFADLGDLAECMSGPGITPSPAPPPPTGQQCLESFDETYDGDVDLVDFAAIQRNIGRN